MQTLNRHVERSNPNRHVERSDNVVETSPTYEARTTEYRHVERSVSEVETSPTLKQGMSRQARHDGELVRMLFRFYISTFLNS